MFTAAVSGASGYVYGEVLRLLAGHPEVEVATVTAHSNAGERLGAVQPHLLTLADKILTETTAESLAGHDVVFLALPHGASGEIAAQLGPDTVVIDAAADHRLESAQAWETFYGSEHQGTWPYGLPELPGQRAELRAPAGSPSPAATPPQPCSAWCLLRRWPGGAARRGDRRCHRHVGSRKVAEAAPSGL